MTDLVERIESEAAIASPSGQYASLTEIAAEVQVALKRLEKAEAALGGVRSIIEGWETAHGHLGLERGYYGPSCASLRRALGDGA